MTRKLLLAFAASAALVSPALASQRGLPDRAGCTHCLPGITAGGASVKARGRSVTVPAPALRIVVAARAGAPATKGSPIRAPVATVSAVHGADCGCAKGSCPTHA